MTDHSEDDAPIIRIAHTILQDGMNKGASEAHIVPSERDVAVVLRVAGEMHESMKLPSYVHEPLVARYKEMAAIEPTIEGAQPGRIPIRWEQRDHTVMAAVAPTPHGESVVLTFIR